ncbi:secreted RxLR effector protein 78-like [Cornus florida]|uniref:secreted RxLR effector protein 78-like n=1 Tax=Cornus florida TaxID=4283 RepID=UPI00289CECF2|nr:secreted RxLR effector protein 78-like [Cornus florida]
MALKVDLKKAYDSVEWGFIQRMLQVYGFSVKWINWITKCISSPKFSILCNGVPAGFFSASRGIRQGCPLSPLLFSFVIEYFSNLMEQAIEEGKIKLYKAVAMTDMKISYAFYANDLLMVVKAYMSTAKAILDVFK